MAACPQCQRPVAMARARCLYCGAALDPGLVATVAAAAAPAAAPTLPAAADRVVVLFDSTGLDAATLAGLMNISPVEAATRTNRGWQLQRIAPSSEAETEAARLRAAGLRVQSLPEAQVRHALEPEWAEGGRAITGGLELRTSGGVTTIRAEAVLVVIAGRIHRERQSEEPRRARVTRTLEPGFRFHVHRVHDPRPIEIDPDAFTFDEPRHPPTSSWLEIHGWLERLVGPGAIDDTFRFVPPALGVAGPPAREDLTRALADRPRKRNADTPATLDNLAQFRLYSGWRGAARRAAGRG